MLRVALLSLFVLLGSTQIAAARTGQLPARSVPSAGGACYYQCPPEYQGSPQTGLGAGGSNTNCYYDSGSSCQYNTATGTRTNGDTNCPEQLQATNCGSTNPGDNEYFKRSHVPTELTPGQKRIRDLQYRLGERKSKKSLRKKRSDFQHRLA